LALDFTSPLLEEVMGVRSRMSANQENSKALVVMCTRKGILARPGSALGLGAGEVEVVHP